MHPDKQRIKIAEICGYTNVEQLDDQIIGMLPQSPVSFRLDVPDYLIDLNAMHLAERRLNTEQKREFFLLLHDLLPDETYSVFAPAHIRAEAFLKTFGEWEEDS